MKPADVFFTDGCGRCSLMGTPSCKVQKWKKELAALRKIIQSTDLKEERKWGMPTYTLEKANVLMITAFKEYCSISFFKGILLEDSKGILSSPGEQSQSTRLIKFRSVAEIIEAEIDIKVFIKEAIQNEKAGRKVEFSKSKVLVLSPEFTIRMDKDSSLKNAFNALTPGRQRSHHLYISSAKQAKTRADRVERCIPVIMKGKGWNEY